MPGLIPLDGMVTADVTIRAIDVPAALDDTVATGPNWQRSDDRFLLELPAIGRFLLEGGHSIGFARAPDVGDQDIAIFLAGNVFGILLHQRNHIVLHASAIAVNGKAVLFCGVSGAGKSTLAAALGARGYTLVTDDQAAITLDDAGVPVVHPDGRFLKLWSKSIDALALDDRKGEAMRDRMEKFYVDPGTASDAAMPVGAVYMLFEDRPPREPGIARPNVVDGSRLLIANAYRPVLVRRMGQRQAYFQIGAAIAHAAGIFTLSRPMRFSAMDDTVSWLEAHWAEIGLTAATEVADVQG
ncbi:HPr kinase/phosphorylase [Sphingomonas sp. MMS24-J45]|uniref:HPr kinase/phosphorylase n=1 Tax=Sphingomonas sp. MMS24-J45 TaxID=3238806 RepID=UPI00384B3253